MKKWLLAIVLLSVVPLLAMAQAKEEMYTRDWKKADSLLDRGMPQSAMKIAEEVYRKAKSNNQQVQMTKAQLYMMRAAYQSSETAAKDAITKAEQEISTAPFPASAIWQSIAAQLYWNYYQQNRWKILGRTAVSGETAIADIEQWDAARFYSKVSALYTASLTRAADLKKVSIESYDPILVKGTNTRVLRPTLFDLLAFRAIAFFENDEKDIADPAFRFEMDDATAFAPAKDFINHRFRSQDSLSTQYHAVLLYQQLLAMHTTDANPSALIDADLQRLAFVYRASVLPNKKELYLRALQQIEVQYAANPLSALAAYRGVELMLQDDDVLYRGRGKQVVPGKSKDYVTAKKKLEAIISKYPESEGGASAQNLLQSIVQPQLSIQCEEVILPDEAAKILLSYQNVSKVWIRIAPLSVEDFKAAYVNEERYNDRILALKPAREWAIDLPASEDHNPHSTEIKIDALPRGLYIVIISHNKDFTKTNNIITASIFQASRLSVVMQQGGNGYILDRKTGMPVTGATVELYREKYNNKTNTQETEKAATATSDKNGTFTLVTASNYGYNALIVKGTGDVLYLREYLNFYKERESVIKEHKKTFFFTDRAIYRPGQTIYYKGIILRTQDGEKKNDVVANENTSVTLYDVNGQKVATQDLTTNEFGSFTGSFTAPQGVLTGSMSINNGLGSVSFQVEEYKRPKFAVSFDTLKKDYALNETITVTGRSMAYAGNSVDGAAVSYRVVRNTRWPYFWMYRGWGYLPTSAQMEIARGNATTRADGSFDISFNAIPDRSVDEKTLPVFTYTVYADVTDLNGETRSGTQNINAGYRSLALSLAVPENSLVKPDTIQVRTENLNGQFVSANVQVRINKLLSPGKVYRKRLWAVPDQFIMDEATFRQYFPADEYKEESDPMTWQKGETVWEKAFATTADGNAAIPGSTWKANGWYVIEAETKDRNGKQILEKKYVQVWDKNNGGNTTAPLLAVPATQQALPGAKPSVYVVSGYDNANMIQQVSYMDGKIETAVKLYDGKPIIWEKQITEADRGGIYIQYLMVKENRVYTEASAIDIPWDNKDLEISWETHRDKLLPGAKETWTMVVRGNKKEKVAAEMVATLYDASLDAYTPHSWDIYNLFPSLRRYTNWNINLGFGLGQNRMIAYQESRDYRSYDKIYDRLVFPDEMYMGGMRRGRGEMYEMSAVQAAPIADAVAKESKKVANQTADASIEKEEGVTTGIEEPIKGTGDVIPVRTNLNETAFFYPQLKTDADGNVRIQFAIPEALTEWKMLAFAHTKDMSTGMLQGKVKTQKDLMVVPGLPRFLRQGDDIMISAKISNMSNADLNGVATLQILDATTMKPLNLPFRLQAAETVVAVAQGQSTNATWNVHVPESLYEPVIIRITASAGNFTDGEENMLPILTNRMMVTETLPLWINGNGTKQFSFDKLKASGSSNTISHYNLAVEYTSNPAWYAVQALPYLMEYPYECAEQTFNKYYATALAAYIVEKAPRIKEIFRSWQSIDTAALLSNLEKNQELKSALLEETPWVLEAKSETEQKKRIAMLFQSAKLSETLDATTRKLEDMLLPEGAFPWFKGMYADRYITQYIATGLLRLQHLGIKDGKGSSQRILNRVLPYLDKSIQQDYDLLIKNKAKLDQQNISYIQVQYLYLRSFTDKKPSENKGYDYYNKQAAKYWPSFNPYTKGMTAIAAYRKADSKTANDIIASLRETAIRKEEMGMYWMEQARSYWWYDAPVETQALLIECFTEVVKAPADVDAMRVWLLKNKQTNNWHTTKATADACYALLLNGTEWLTSEPVVTIALGSTEIKSSAQKQEKGTGYFKTSYKSAYIKPAMGDIKLTVQDNANSPSWGAVYWQYFEDMDKITGAATPLTVNKKLFIQRNTDRGPVLEAIATGNDIKVGDKVISRIEIIVDRDMEYVHLKDMRASCFEPVNVISSYKWQGGLGYYESTRDAATNFFFSYLQKGKYVFEYPVFVTGKGNFSAGIATIQCMYAPEFSSHSEGVRVSVK